MPLRLRHYSTLPLFEVGRAVHARDPATSFKAAEQAGGLAARHHEAMLALLRAWTLRSFTYEEIADGTGLEKHAVARRLPELERAGLIQRCGTAKLSSGRLGTLWRIVPFQEAA